MQIDSCDGIIREFMKIKYILGCGCGSSRIRHKDVTVLIFCAEKDVCPVVGDNTQVMELYPHLTFKVTDIINTMFNDEVRVCCEFGFPVKDDVIDALLINGWVKR